MEVFFLCRGSGNRLVEIEERMDFVKFEWINDLIGADFSDPKPKLNHTNFGSYNFDLYLIWGTIFIVKADITGGEVNTVSKYLAYFYL